MLIGLCFLGTTSPIYNKFFNLVNVSFFLISIQVVGNLLCKSTNLDTKKIFFLVWYLEEIGKYIRAVLHFFIVVLSIYNYIIKDTL